MFIRISKDKNNPYVMVNKGWVNDSRLSYKAKGVMLYLLSKPDDWQVYSVDIEKHGTDGRDSIRSAIKELMEIGYVQRKRIRDEKGMLRAVEYVVSEVSSKDGFSNIGFSNIGKTDTTNNDVTNNNITDYKNDNGVFSTEKDSFVNREVVNAMKTYMNDLYKQRTKKKHPVLKPAQYRRIYDSIASFAEENSLDYDAIVEVMICYFNNKALNTDWNINHFATEGIMQNRLYESGVI